MKKNKKLLSLAGLGALVLGIGLSILGPASKASEASAATHVHQNEITWSCTRNGHYHPCLEDGCNVDSSNLYLHSDDGFDYEKHIDSNGDGKCDVCSYYISKPAAAEYIVDLNTKLPTTTWYMIESEILTIGGDGATPDYTHSFSRDDCYIKAPWFNSDGALKTNISKIVIAQGVTSIGNSMFYNGDAGEFDSVTEIVFPNSILSIGEYAFNQFRNVTSLNLPDTIQTIGASAFSCWTNITFLHLPKSLKIIEESLFEYSTLALHQLIIPEGVTQIKKYAFTGVESLSTVILPSTLTSIGSQAFWTYSTIGLIVFKSRTVPTVAQQHFDIRCKAFYVPVGLEKNYNDYIKLANYSGLTYELFGVYFINCPRSPYGVISSNRPNDLFLGTKFDLASNVAIDKFSSGFKIEITAECAFGSKLTKLTIADGPTITDITETKTFVMPKKDVTITASFEPHRHRFSDYYVVNSTAHYRKCEDPDCNLAEEEIKSHTLDGFAYEQHADKNKDNKCDVCGAWIGTVLGHYIEDLCHEGNDNTWYSVTADKYTSDVTLTIGGFGAMPNYDDYGSCHYRNRPWESDLEYITNIVILPGVTHIGDFAFADMDCTQVSLGSVESIGFKAFYYADLKEVIIPNSVKSIGEFAFYSCYELEKVVLSKKQEEIARSTFEYCEQLKDVTIPYGVKTIDVNAFGFCDSLKELIIPETVTFLEYDCFYDCYFENLIFKGETLPYIDYVHDIHSNNIYVNQDNIDEIKREVGKNYLTPYYSFYSAFMFDIDDDSNINAKLDVEYLPYQEYNDDFSYTYGKAIDHTSDKINITVSPKYPFVVDSILDGSKDIKSSLSFTCGNRSHTIKTNAKMHNHTLSKATYTSSAGEYIAEVKCACGYVYNEKSTTVIVEDAPPTCLNNQILHNSHVFESNIFETQHDKPYEVKDTQLDHDIGNHVPAVDPTCDKPGCKEYYSCSICSLYFAGLSDDTLIGDEDDLTAWKSEGGDGYVAPIGHHFSGNVSYRWNGDKCTASWNCDREGCNATESETVTGDFVEDTPATCTTNTFGHYDAKFTNKAFKEQEAPANSYEVPNTALGHNFGGEITYTWDGDTCTAEWSCQRDGCTATEKETKKGTLVIDTEAKCLVNAFGHFEVTFNKTAFGSASTEENSYEVPDTALGHNFGGEVTYTWDENVCTAIWYCQNEGCEESQSEIVDGVYIKDNDATCETNENGHYWVMFTTPGFVAQSTGKGSVEVPDTAFGHEYGGEVVYSWNGDQCTASWGCLHDPCTSYESETKTATLIIDTPATCEVNAFGHFEVTFDKLEFGSTSTKPNSYEVPDSATGHNYGEVTCVWDEYTCTGTAHCTNPGCNSTLTETVIGEYEKDTDPTCTKNEKGHYSAEFILYPEIGVLKTEANSVEINGTKLGHHFSGEVTYTWDGDMCTASWACDHPGCNQVERETVKAEYVVDIPAGCTTNEFGHLVAKFTNPNFADCATEMVEKPNSAHGHVNHAVYSWNAEHTKCEAIIMCQHGDYNYKENGVITYEDGYAIATFTHPELETQRDPFVYVEPGMPTWEIATIAGGSAAGAIAIAVIIIIVVKKKK